MQDHIIKPPKECPIKLRQTFLLNKCVDIKA